MLFGTEHKPTVVVIAAHADDEALGCGGTIARHAAAGHEVHLIVMTDGTGARGRDTESTAQRRRALNAASKILGFASVRQLGFPDNAMDSVPLLEVTKAIEKATEFARPSILYTHFSNDLNIDHCITSRAVLTAFRPQSSCSANSIYGFEVPSSTEWRGATNGPVFNPDTFVNISDFADLKHRALKEYALEMRPAPHSRSYSAVKALNEWRGQSVGCFSAEAFVTIRAVR